MKEYIQKLDRFLALDTSGDTICCAVYMSGVIHSLSASRDESRARNIAVLTGELLDNTSLSFSDICGVIVALGPGSFTGLRVGLSFAKGLVATSDVALLGVTRFQQAQYQLRQEKEKSPGAVTPHSPFSLLVRMKGDSYYRCRISAGESVVDVATLAEIADVSGSVCFIDSDIPTINGQLFGFAAAENSAGAMSLQTDMDSMYGAAFEVLESGKAPPWTELEPLYIQRSAAEIRAAKSGDTKNAKAGS